MNDVGLVLTSGSRSWFVPAEVTTAVTELPLIRKLSDSFAGIVWVRGAVTPVILLDERSSGKSKLVVCTINEVAVGLAGFEDVQLGRVDQANTLLDLPALYDKVRKDVQRQRLDKTEREDSP